MTSSSRRPFSSKAGPVAAVWTLLVALAAYAQLSAAVEVPWVPVACPRPPAAPPAGLTVYEIAAGRCNIALVPADSPAAAGPGVAQLAAVSRIDASLDTDLRPIRLPLTVQLSNASSPPEAALKLAVPPGGEVTLRDLYLGDVTLESPTSGDLNKVLLPVSVDLPTGAVLHLEKVILEVSEQQLGEYVDFLRGVPYAPVWTDNTTFVFIGNYSQAPTGMVDAQSVLLVAPTAASYRGQRLTRTQAALAAVTDSYVLGTDNFSTTDWVRTFGEVSSPAPAFIYVAGNVSLSPRFDPTWPQSGIPIRRPLVLAGSYWRPTSVDLGMTAGQFVIEPPYGNVTLMNLWLENLGLGDAASAAISGGNSIVLQNQLWAFSYLREEPRLVVRNAVEVLLQDQIDNVVYWANAFNSPTDFWRNNTRFLRDTLRYTVLRFQRGQAPGEFIIQQALKKDQLMYNITYTTRNLAATPLPLNYDPAVQGSLVTSSASPLTGVVHNVSEMQFSIWNQQQGQCNRQHVLVFANDVDLSPKSSLPPPPPDAIASDADGRAELKQLTSWPPPGGLVVDCPVQLVGGSETSAAIRAANSAGLDGRRVQIFLQYQLSTLFWVTPQPLSQQSADVLPPGPLLGFKDVRLVGLRQCVTANSSGPLSAAEQALGTWAFPLWWINRTFDSSEPAVLGLVNVTLVLPGPEFEALARQVAAGPDFVLPTSTQRPATGRKLLQQGGGTSGPSVAFRNTRRVTPDRICVTQLSGLGLNGSDVCMIPDPAPLPADYLPPDGVVGISQTQGSTWPAWKYVLAIVLPVLAAAAAASVVLCCCLKKRRQRRKQPAAASRKPVSSEQYIAFGGGAGAQGGYPPGSPDGSARGVVGPTSPHPVGSTGAPSVAGSASGGSVGAGVQRRAAAAAAGAGGVGAGAFPACRSPHMSAHGSTGDLELTPPPQQQQQRASYEAVSTLGDPPAAWACATPGFIASGAAAAGGRGAAGDALGGRLGGRSRRPSDQWSSGSSSRPSGATSTTWQRLSSAIHTVSREMQMKRLESAFNMAAAAGMLKGAGAVGDPATPGLPGVSGGNLPTGGKSSSASVGGSTSPLSGRASGVLPVGSDGAGSSLKQQGGAPQQQQALGTSPPPAAGGQSPQQQQLSRTSANLVSGRARSKQQLQLHEAIGKGTFGVVYRATWRGIPAAVKVMQLSAAAWSGQQTSVREQMAVMEAVLSSTLSHPNTVQVYTYMLRPVSRMEGAAAAAAAATTHRPSQEAAAAGATSSSSTLWDAGDSSGGGDEGTTEVVVAWELLLVMEYCELGSLRQAITEGLLDDRVTGLPHYPTILSIALDIANAMLHLHSEGVVHGDLKAGNVLLRSAVGSQRRPTAAAGGGGGGGLGMGSNGSWPGQEVLMAKVADFGLASQLQEQDTHISGVHRGTLTHMAPELLLHGRASKASDVYSFAILLWELYTARKAFQGVPKVLLGHLVCESRQRPAWAGDVPQDYQHLVEACWAHEAANRPPFEDICCQLEAMLEKEDTLRAQLAARVGITSSDAAAAKVAAAAADAAGAEAGGAVGCAGSDSTAKGAGAGGSSSPHTSSEALVTADAGSRVPSSSSSSRGGASGADPGMPLAAPPAAVAAAAAAPAAASSSSPGGLQAATSAIGPAVPARSRPPARAYVSPFAAVQQFPEGGG